MNIVDFIPKYPDINDPDFNDKIYKKREFLELRATDDINKFSTPGEYWKHQKILQRFMSPHTMYNRLLVVHAMGRGKTCGSIAITEAHKHDKFTDKPFLIIVPNSGLAKQWKDQILYKCTPASEFVVEENDSDIKINKMLKYVYDIKTLDAFRNEIDKMNDKAISEKYSSTIIIVDEAHKLRQDLENDKTVGRYNSYKRFFQNIGEYSKLVLLTATPMYNSVMELPGLFNLMLSADNQLPTKTSFVKEYMTVGGSDSNSDVATINIDKLAQKTRTIAVSYIREGGDFPAKVYNGSVSDGRRFLKTVDLEVSDLQESQMKLAYANDKNNANSLWGGSRQASNFVFPDPDIEPRDLFKHLVDSREILPKKIGKSGNLIRSKHATYTSYSIKSAFKLQIRDNISKYSTKYDYIVKMLREHPDRPVLIFNPIVSGVGGAIFVGLVLELFGYSKLRGSATTKGLRYSIITGENLGVNRKKVIETFNSAENRDGSILQVLIISMTAAEGVNLYNVKDEIVVTPYWNTSGNEQALGRGLRPDSLKHESGSDRTVYIHQLAAIGDSDDDTDGTFSIDLNVYKNAENKDVEIAQGLRFLKTKSMDCALNYNANVGGNEDYSRECDYDKCEYKCMGVKGEPPYDPADIKGEIDNSTFLLYYSDHLVNDIVDDLREKLAQYEYIDIAHYMKHQEYPMLVITAIEKMKNRPAKNSLNQSCYVGYDGNLLFLTFNRDNGGNDGSFFDSWYPHHPYINFETDLETVVRDDIIAKNINMVADVCSTKKVSNMDIESRIIAFETFANKSEDTAKIFGGSHYHTTTNPLKCIVHHLNLLKYAENTLDYYDFERELGVKNARCWNSVDNKWYDCKVDAVEPISSGGDGGDSNGNVKPAPKPKSQAAAGSAVASIVDPGFDIYGIVTANGEFKIVDKTIEKDKAKSGDKRGKAKGGACKNFGVKKLTDVYDKLNLKYSTKEELMSHLSENDDYRKTLDETIKINKAELCRVLMGWFKKEGRLVTMT